MNKRILALGTCTILFGCGPLDPCGNRVLTEVQSPTGKHRIVVFERDCGATTAFSTQVSVLRSGQVFHEKGTLFVSSSQANCFVCDSDEGRAAGWVDARWISPTEAQIRYHQGARVFLAESKLGDVHVTFIPTPP